MLGKVLKYDIKWIYKVIGIFYILAFIFSVLGRALSEIENSMIFSVISKILFGTAIAMLVNSLINCLMRLWARVVKNMYKDESYLTHTLPVSKKTIYGSKVITAIITIFTTTLVSLICLFICYYSKTNIEALKVVLDLVASTYNTTVIQLIPVMFLVIFFEILFVFLTGYVGIILGHKSNKNKMFKSIIIAFSIYMVMQVVTLGILFVIGIINPEIMNLINTIEKIDVNIIKTLMYIAIVIYGIYSVFLYKVGQKQFEKGVNVD